MYSSDAVGIRLADLVALHVGLYQVAGEAMGDEDAAHIIDEDALCVAEHLVSLLRIADQYGATEDDYELLAGAVAAGDTLVLRTPVPVTARYVLIWLTNLPYGEGAYQGGIRDFQIRG